MSMYFRAKTIRRGQHIGSHQAQCLKTPKAYRYCGYNQDKYSISANVTALMPAYQSAIIARWN